jgi:predicted GNAT family acetyltransferase
MKWEILMNELIQAAAGKFYIGDSAAAPRAEIEYIIDQDGRMVIEHTRVAESERGQGLGFQLVSHAAEWARSEKRQIIAHCRYAHKILSGSDQFKGLLIENNLNVSD